MEAARSRASILAAGPRSLCLASGAPSPATSTRACSRNSHAAGGTAQTSSRSRWFLARRSSFERARYLPMGWRTRPRAGRHPARWGAGCPRSRTAGRGQPVCCGAARGAAVVWGRRAGGGGPVRPQRCGPLLTPLTRGVAGVDRGKWERRRILIMVHPDLILLVLVPVGSAWVARCNSTESVRLRGSPGSVPVRRRWANAHGPRCSERWVAALQLWPG